MEAGMGPLSPPSGPRSPGHRQGCRVRSGIHSDKRALLSVDVGPVDRKLNSLSLTRIKPQHSAEVCENLMPLHVSQTRRETWPKSCFFTLPNLPGTGKENYARKVFPLLRCPIFSRSWVPRVLLAQATRTGSQPSSTAASTPRSRGAARYQTTDVSREEGKAWKSCFVQSVAPGDHLTPTGCVTCTRQASSALTVPHRLITAGEVDEKGENQRPGSGPPSRSRQASRRCWRNTGPCTVRPH